MKKKFMSLGLVICMLSVFFVGVYAGSNLQAVTAYLNYGIKVAKGGQVQALTDAQGNAVTPITYNNSTYLPVRAISNLLGHTVDWDGASQCVLLDGSSVPPELYVATAQSVPYVYGPTYDLTFVNNLMNSIHGLAYDDYTVKEYLVNGVWQGKDYTVGEYPAFVFHGLTIEDPNVRYNESSQAIISFEAALCNTLIADGFTLVQTDEYGNKHFVRGTMEFRVDNYENRSIDIDLETGYQSCCAAEK